ncbi:reverse transcriptase [Gossypium australe]|uniref:Reverse transcriptase n=1 Tax=Gossypium australe TaxID=47621 RepID=A0A5B6VB36_9ROSI|nr:reverse transcriptase [Gossypium australe]
MALKLDMIKAYDRVEWPFIKDGVSFNPSRGLRQGNPLSPYLFLFCGKGLSALMRLASQEKKVLGVKVCRSFPPITHLMFVDDCILFGDVSNRRITMLKDILRE